MKKLTTTLLLFSCLYLNAQQVSYKLILDDPSAHPKTSVNLEIMNLDFGFRNIDGLSFNSAIWGYHEPIYGKVGINYLVRRSWFVTGRLANPNNPPVWEIDLGGYLILRTTKKSKPTKVVLKSTNSTASNGNRVTTTTFITIPATVKTMSGIRGGVYHKSSPMGFEKEGLGTKDVLIDMETSISSQAIYGGLFTRKLRNVVISTDQYGQRINSLGTEVYLDGMLFVSNRFTSVANSDANKGIPGGLNVTDTIKANSNQGLWGIRVGYKKYQIAPKSEIGKRFGMSATFELGYRPFHGVFMNAGIGLTIIKRRPKAS